MTGNGAAMINSKTLKNSTESWAFFYYQQKLFVAYSDIPLPYNDKKKFIKLYMKRMQYSTDSHNALLNYT